MMLDYDPPICPVCKKEMGQMISMKDDRTISENSLTCCVYCGAFLKVAKMEGKTIHMTECDPEELLSLPDSERMALVRLRKLCDRIHRDPKHLEQLTLFSRAREVLRGLLEEKGRELEKEIKRRLDSDDVDVIIVIHDKKSGYKTIAGNRMDLVDAVTKEAAKKVLYE